MRGCETMSSSRVSLHDMGFCNSQNHDTHAGYAQVPLDGETVQLWPLTRPGEYAPMHLSSSEVSPRSVNGVKFTLMLGVGRCLWMGRLCDRHIPCNDLLDQWGCENVITD